MPLIVAIRTSANMYVRRFCDYACKILSAVFTYTSVVISNQKQLKWRVIVLQLKQFYTLNQQMKVYESIIS